MRAALVAVGLFLACVAPAWAAPARVQINGACGATSGCTLTGAPTNGNIVAWIIPNTAAVGSITVKDSNGLSLTEHQPAGNCVTGNTICVAIFDYVVSGSPTSNYQFTGITAYDLTCGGSAQGVEVSGAVLGSAMYAANNTTSGTSLVATLPGVANTDFQGSGLFCVAATSPSMTISNGSNVTWLSVDSKTALATSTASSTATGSAVSLSSAVVAYVDYPALGGGGSSPATQWIGAYDPVFELMLAEVG